MTNIVIYTYFRGEHPNPTYVHGDEKMADLVAALYKARRFKDWRAYVTLSKNGILRLAPGEGITRGMMAAPSYKEAIAMWRMGLTRDHSWMKHTIRGRTPMTKEQKARALAGIEAPLLVAKL